MTRNYSSSIHWHLITWFYYMNHNFNIQNFLGQSYKIYCLLFDFIDYIHYIQNVHVKLDEFGHSFHYHQIFDCLVSYQLFEIDRPDD